MKVCALLSVTEVLWPEHLARLPFFFFFFPYVSLSSVSQNVILELTFVFVKVPVWSILSSVSCFSITTWEDKETQQFDLDSSVMDHLES